MSAPRVHIGLDSNQRSAFRGIRHEDDFARADAHPLVERHVRQWRLRLPGTRCRR